MLHYPRPPFPDQHQPMPGKTAAMNPTPDHGEDSYKGSGRLNGKKAVITGGDSGIGRAVAIAYAREGADVLISYLDEHEDARETERLVKEAGRKAVLLPGDIQDPGQCRAVIAKAVAELGGIDILVNNAAHQASFKSIDEISDEEWELTFKVNIHAMFYLTKAAVAHMKPGSCIINTASINSDVPNPTLLAYATTKGAIYNFTAGLAQMLAEKGIRANAVAPGPIWTPLIPSTLPDDSVKNFGKQVPMKRPGQPAELATAYVMLADPLSSYVSGATIAVTGGKPFLEIYNRYATNPGAYVIVPFGNHESAAAACSIDFPEQSRISRNSPRADVAALPATAAFLGHIPKQFVRTSRTRFFFCPPLHSLRLAFRRRLSLPPFSIRPRHFRHTPGRCSSRARSEGFVDINLQARTAMALDHTASACIDTAASGSVAAITAAVGVCFGNERHCLAPASLLMAEIELPVLRMILASCASVSFKRFLTTLTCTRSRTSRAFRERLLRRIIIGLPAWWEKAAASGRYTA